MIAAILRDDIIRYPDTTEVVSSLSASLEVTPGELSLFAGSESGVRTVFDVMVEPGDVVMCLKPSYHGYSREAFSHRARLHTVGYDSALRLDGDAILDGASRGPRVAFLGNPDGLGRPMPRDLVQAVLAKLERRGGLLVVDEAYHGFGAPSVRDLIPEHPQLAVLRTFSKVWGLAGVRCGYSIAHASTTGLFRRVKLRNEVSGLTLAVVQHALRHPELREAYAEAVTTSRGVLSSVFDECGFEVVPSSANFIVMRVPPPPRATAILARAQEARIAIAAPRDDLIRVTIGPLARMRPVIDLFRAEARLASQRTGLVVDST